MEAMCPSPSGGDDPVGPRGAGPEKCTRIDGRTRECCYTRGNPRGSRTRDGQRAATGPFETWLGPFAPLATGSLFADTGGG